jgi:hypothetical protein
MAIARAFAFAALFALALLALLGVAARAQDEAARVVVQIPQASAAVLMLEVGIRAPQGPTADHPGAVVRLRRDGGEAIEVGRLSLGPSPSGGEQRFQFDIGRAVRRLGLAGTRAEVEIEWIDRAGRLAPVSLELSGVRVVTR